MQNQASQPNPTQLPTLWVTQRAQPRVLLTRLIRSLYAVGGVEGVIELISPSCEHNPHSHPPSQVESNSHS